MRLPIIAGNWKMHKTIPESVEFAESLIGEVSAVENAEIVICPPYTALYKLFRRLKGSNIGLGAQDMFWKAQGAYTSRVSAAMLLDAGCSYTIIGHSETRGRFGTSEDLTEAQQAFFAESDDTVNAKLHASLGARLKPIVCVGETISERTAGQTDDVIGTQLQKGLAGISPEQAAALVVAYEPVWAIGTGEVCDSTEANRVCSMIRSVVASLFGNAASESVRVQYGGSVKPDNARELLAQLHIDGALVGGASLKVSDFVAIVRSV